LYLKGSVHREFVPPNTTVDSDSVTLWDAWEKMCDESDQNIGAPKIGSFITTARPPTRPWKPESLRLATTSLLFPVLPTRRTSEAVIALFFSKLKTKRKGHFETVSDIQRESQAVLHSIKENYLHISITCIHA
jgi:hypothetical protein